MIIDEKDAVRIDNIEKSFLLVAYPTIRQAFSKHLEKISKKKSLERPKQQKWRQLKTGMSQFIINIRWF
jgi:hypothetical protein